MMSQTIVDQARNEVSKIKNEIDKLRDFRKQTYFKLESELGIFQKTLDDFKEKIKQEDKISIISTNDLAVNIK
jgi:hypothetical protein